MFGNMQGQGNVGGPGLKREFNMEEGDGGNAKRPKGNGPHVEMRLLLANKNAGAIIGKGGTNIKRLRQEYNATVSLPDAPGPERVLSLASDLGNACAMLNDIFSGIENDRGTTGGACVAKFLIHESQAGGVIGKGGAKVKELRSQFGNGIKVYSECCPQSSDRIVEISADAATIKAAAFAIYEFLNTRKNAVKIKQIPPRGMNSPYDPSNFDEYFALEYGGYTTMETQGGGGGFGGNMAGGRGGRGRGSRGSRGGGGRGSRGGGQRGGGAMGGGGMGAGAMAGGGGTGRGGMSMLSGFSQAARGGGGMRGARGGMRGGGLAGAPGVGSSLSLGLAEAFGGYGGMGEAYGGYGAEHTAEAQEFTQVSIPNEYAGAIIGKGGMRIKQIRMESGASITIDEPQPETNERIINISGSAEQIQNAQYLLQMRVLLLLISRQQENGLD